MSDRIILFVSILMTYCLNFPVNLLYLVGITC